MEIGVCAGADKAQLLKDAGADFVELSVTGALVPLSEEGEWAEKRAALLALALPARTFNLFLPGSFRLTGPPDTLTDTDTLRRYVATAMRRARKVGGEVIVFGSGGARRVPDGFRPERATGQIRIFLALCAEASDETGVTLAIEPLNREESNIINTVAEAVRDYAAVLNHPGIRVLADTYHMEKENEPLSAIRDHAPYIAHVHTADTNRAAPSKGTYDHVALFRLLREIGYAGRVSVEANIPDMAADISGAMAHLRAAKKAASE